MSPTKKPNWSVVVLIFVIMTGLVLRIYRLDSVFSTLNRDEAAVAYNAYLLQTTGLDEWGHPLAATLLSFGDWKLIGYPMILIGLFKYLPLSDSLVRLPSVLAGVGLIGLTYLLGLQLNKNRVTALMTAIFIATTPIFFFYSRLAYEANVALFYVVAATCCLLVSQKSRYQLWLEIMAAVFMLLAGLTYNTPIFILPILIFCYVLHRGVMRVRLWLRPVALLIVVFWAVFFLTKPVLFHKTGITIFSDATTTLARNNYYQSFSPLLRPILGNQYVYYAKLMTVNLGRSLSYNFLVARGGQHPWHQLPNWGHISPVSYVLFFMGLIYAVYIGKNKFKLLPVLKSGMSPDMSLLLLAGLALIPATMTIDAPHATRSLLSIYLLVVLGPNLLLSGLNYHDLKAKILVWILILCQGLYFGGYVYSYFNLDDRWIGELRPGFSQLINQIGLQTPNQVAIVADGYQYILLAWYLKVPPGYYLKYNQRGASSLYGLRYGERIGQFRFIVSKADRLAEEKSLIWYDDQTKSWQIE